MINWFFQYKVKKIIDNDINTEDIYNSKKIKLYGFVSAQLPDFTIENIEILIKNNKLENKLIKPLYIS